MKGDEFLMEKIIFDYKKIIFVVVFISLFSCNTIQTQNPQNDTPGTYQETTYTKILPTSTRTIMPTNQLITETKTIMDNSPTKTFENNYLYPMIYFANNDIYEMDIDELANSRNNQKILSNVTDDTELLESIIPSPDGTKLLLEIHTVLTHLTHLDIYDIKSGKKIESLGNPNLYSVEPAWSSDGKFIATNNYNPESAIRIDPTGKCTGSICIVKYFRPQNTNEYGDLSDPMWTKDDREIVFLFSKGRKADLCIGFIETLNYKCPVKDKEIYDISINNDNQIIFDDFTENGDSIYLLDLQQYISEGNSNLLKLSPEKASFYYPIFSTNGDSLIYISNKNGNKDIYYSEIINKLPKDWIAEDHQLTNDEYTKTKINISYDGKMLIYSADTNNPKVTTIIPCIKSLWAEEISNPPRCISDIFLINPIWGKEIKASG
jgi:Tol biopolymer transport system component